jgi:hypothetical protein
LFQTLARRLHDDKEEIEELPATTTIHRGRSRNSKALQQHGDSDGASDDQEEQNKEEESRKRAAQQKESPLEEEDNEDDDDQVLLLDKDDGDDACNDVNEQSGGHGREREGSRAARLHALAEAASHGEVGYSSAAGVVDQQGLAVAVLKQQMEGSGKTEEQEKNCCPLVVPTLLFKKMNSSCPIR